MGEHYLSVPPTAESVTVDAGEPAAPADASAGAETVFWQSIMNSTDPADFEDYLRQFPDGTFVRLARRRMEALPDAPIVDAVAPVADIDVTHLDVAQLRLIAEEGDARAQTELGERYEDGRGGVALDYREAVAWYRRAAAQGDVRGQATSARCTPTKRVFRGTTTRP